MDEEFALCWNNFQDNIASGFQNLYDRGDLVDVTLACDGKLLQAHKIVLAICSPYFQEMFITNPCKHPIIVLKDVSYTVMSELLQFMYQGVVNVKHADLAAFMKIAQALHIKGLATSTAQKSSTSPAQNNNNTNSNSSGSLPTTSSKTIPGNLTDSFPLNSSIDGKSNLTTSSSVASIVTSLTGGGGAQKRPVDYSGESLSVYPTRKSLRRITTDSGDNDIASESMGTMSSDEVFLPPIPHISMAEARFDLNNVKRENDALLSPGGMRSLVGQSAFPFDYNSSSAYSKNMEFPNDLHGISEYTKSGGINHHMDIPAVAPGERWSKGKLEFMLSQRGKPLLVHDGHTFGIQYIRKDKKYWQCNLSRKFNCKARVTTTETGEIIVTNNEHCHTEIRQHLRKDYKGKFGGGGGGGGGGNNAAANAAAAAHHHFQVMKQQHSDFEAAAAAVVAAAAAAAAAAAVATASTTTTTAATVTTPSTKSTANSANSSKDEKQSPSQQHPVNSSSSSSSNISSFQLKGTGTESKW